MDPIKKNDSGAAVEDVQHRLVKAGYLAEDQVTGTFGAETENAVLSLCRDRTARRGGQRRLDQIG